MKTKTTALLLAAIVSLSALSGCISVKREVDEPATTTTTTRSSSVLAPTSTTVERTTTY